jgi:hypothetical protein
MQARQSTAKNSRKNAPNTAKKSAQPKSALKSSASNTRAISQYTAITPPRRRPSKRVLASPAAMQQAKKIHFDQYTDDGFIVISKDDTPAGSPAKSRSRPSIKETSHSTTQKELSNSNLSLVSDPLAQKKVPIQ